MIRNGIKQRNLHVTKFLKNSTTTTARNIMSGGNFDTSSVQFTVQDTARIVTLNRPQKLNALDTEMCDSIYNTLNEYSKSKATNLVLVKSSNQPRSLCAGGDVAKCALNNLIGKKKYSYDFFKSEYSMNFQMATYPKPIVVYMDGITMGGGVGLSIHSPFRIATENTKWAMPEMDIGFFPDVGTTFALPRIINIANNKSQMAAYLCLTGDVVTGADAFVLGLASHYIPHDNLEGLQNRLSELHPFAGGSSNNGKYFDMVDEAIQEFSTSLPDSYKFGFTDCQLDVIERAFNIDANESVTSILNSLDSFADASEEHAMFAKQVKDKLLQKSMTSLQVALKLLQENSKDSIESAMKRDLYTAANFCNDTEVVEFSQAVKHKLVDKQKTPYNWKKREELSAPKVLSLLSPKPSILIALNKNHDSVTWKEYPYHRKYQLPREEDITNYITELNTANGGVGNITKNEVIEYFTTINESTKGKIGVAEICKLIIARNYTFNKAGGLQSNIAESVSDQLL
ncbi:hypothetical protein Kpol_251p6 [Vanderwaltozyma polyspora DSM 70294]|uniref:3-hydroxyisobutyryl-CoA hydrolase n=1 Tax=Vanderwaltozyma polyspora (strain ATCC 22028 / DSM 70294 / BCRC 21397 / CBS 2163 / NBRC 10782 / NRRL Y-8283 / UCD 57-17) TaxID=436907 RepID=A7TTD5_VANPO|nr:uncharacterized protein Kpol_251p6 [Vanderwaltozyma polyspora DSM 70294]EDO14476.1 hypothetical protein Kpol_251p6 [Vanderwaltozyma polyspora DSM 70294]